jgi:peptidoglycan hydrolase-like protein with peptidoglycan-binding domain
VQKEKGFQLSFFTDGYGTRITGPLALVATFALAGPAAAAAASTTESAGTRTATAAPGSASASNHDAAFLAEAQHLGQRVLRPGATGHDVRVLQDFLTRAGYPTTVDGQFGPATKASVVAFQRDHHLTPNGVVSLAVARALRAAAAAGAAHPTVAPAPVGHARLNADGTATAPANAPAAIKRVFAAANHIAFKPYIYGGGHGSWNDSGYDCSGSVSYALHGAGLVSTPMDSTEFESYGRPGRGRWITIWTNSGHVYMYVAGLRFDTSAQSSTGSRWTRAGRSSDGFIERHPTGW